MSDPIDWKPATLVKDKRNYPLRRVNSSNYVIIINIWKFKKKADCPSSRGKSINRIEGGHFILVAEDFSVSSWIIVRASS